MAVECGKGRVGQPDDEPLSLFHAAFRGCPYIHSFREDGKKAGSQSLIWRSMLTLAESLLLCVPRHRDYPQPMTALQLSTKLRDGAGSNRTCQMYKPTTFVRREAGRRVLIAGLRGACARPVLVRKSFAAGQCPLAAAFESQVDNEHSTSPTA